jgi:DNA-binding transcriptional regulator PaaX
MYVSTSQAFAPEDLDVLDRAFKTAWAMLVAAAPTRDTSHDEELKTHLRKKLVWVGTGTLDDEDMRQLALECLRSQS